LNLGLGELAALGTAVCWAVTALAFESAGRRVGSLPVNLIRLVIGFVLLIPVVGFVRGFPLPLDASPAAWGWLSLSGLIGFAFGDLCLFRAFVLLGSRLSVLVMSLVPPLTAALGLIFLGETLDLRESIGMALTVGGLAWVIIERTPGPLAPVRPPARGLLLALGGALGQAVGLILSKHGMGSYDAFAANQIRVLAGIVGFAVIFTFTGRWPRVLEALRHREAMRRTWLGGFFGPFLGVSLSLVAVQATRAGVAATIMALTPVIILPASRWIRREHVTLRATLGAIVAVAGVALLAT
jgi:drug/metabolite transporter (DMT)-like permease